MALGSKFEKHVHCRRQEDITHTSWIIHSDSEYGLLLSIQITDTYMLNVIVKEPLNHKKVGCEGWITG